MPNEYNTRDLRIAISSTPEAVYNGIKIAAADTYRGMLTTGRNPMLPDKEKNDDTGKVGRGQEFATEQRSGYVVPPSIEIAEELNIDIIALLARRGMGGAVAAAASQPAEPLARTVTWGMQRSTSGPRQLPSSSVAWTVGGADFIWGGVVVESIRFDQAGAAVPTATVTMVGSGLHKRIRDIVAPPTFPLPAPQRYMFGPETQVGFTINNADGTTTPVVLTDARKLTNFSMTLTNNHRTDDRRPGDKRVDTLTPMGGWYVDSMYYGDRTIGGEMTIVLDTALLEVFAARDDLFITDFYYRARGRFLGATTTQATFEIRFPKCFFRNVRAGDDNGLAVVTMAIFPVDDATYGPMIMNVTTDSTVTNAAFE